jgi:GH43 family beta-xylosidase
VWVNEAPIALVKNNKVFIAYSVLGLLTASADANLLAASSWSKAAQPVFKSNDATSPYGPGHNSFTTW